ncbi:MAG TPA: sensor histidine kinase, partial [Micromonosporaceae bacterium]|nr:sensor histidine kinase [Micromonosporaceae bacterium]
MSDAAVGRNAWQRGIAGWHGVFGALAVFSAVLVAGEDGLPPGQRYLALALLGVLCGWYAAVGARALRRESRRLGLLYLAVAIPLTIAVFAVVPACALMLFVLYPHIWALLSVYRAVAGTVAVLAAVSVVILVQSGPGDGLLPAVLYIVAGLVIALLLGLWITRIIEQSRDRAALVAELAAARQDLAAVSEQAGALAERARVAREIHDTLAQGFASVLLQLEALETELGGDPEAARRHLGAAQRTARANLAEARALVGALTPPDLRATSLVEALRRLVERTGPELGVEIGFAVDGTPRAVPANQEVVLFRATQEALTNVGRHSGAHRAEVRLGFAGSGVSLTVCDDGRGFPPGNGSGGFGLA